MTDSLATIGSAESERLILGPLVDADAAEIQRLTNDSAITDVISFLDAPFTLADARALIAKRASAIEVFMGARRKDDQCLAGVVGLHLRGEDSIEIGYWIATACTGQGFATEALNLATALAAKFLPHRRAMAECLPGNRASWRVLEKCGFRPTGEPGIRPGMHSLVHGAATGTPTRC